MQDLSFDGTRRVLGSRPLIALFALTAFATAACSSDDDDASDSARPAEVAALTGNAANGKLVYETKASPACVSCHKADGKGGPVAGLTEPAADLGEPSQNDEAEELAGYILNGKGTDMPKQTALSNQDVADVIAYMKATFKE
jgi:mono/diheme cytochrome c family protein